MSAERQSVGSAQPHLQIFAILAIFAMGGWLLALHLNSNQSPIPGTAVRDDGERIITGIVVDPAGQPVPGAHVLQVPQFGAEDALRTDHAGRFTLKLQKLGWLSGDMLLVRQRERNLACVVETSNTRKPMKIVLGSAGILVGGVVDQAGAPVAGAEVVSHIVLRSDTGVTPSMLGRPQRTDEQGRYEVRAAPAGYECGVNISAKGYGVNLCDPIRSVSAGAVYEIAQVVCLPADQVLTGIVVDANGDGVPGVNITTGGPGQPSGKDTTDADGHFRVENVRARSVVVSAAKGEQSVTVSAVGGQTDVRIDLSDETGGLMDDSF